jgi:hypothetical protein
MYRGLPGRRSINIYIYIYFKMRRPSPTRFDSHSTHPDPQTQPSHAPSVTVATAAFAASAATKWLWPGHGLRPGPRRSPCSDPPGAQHPKRIISGRGGRRHSVLVLFLFLLLLLWRWRLWDSKGYHGVHEHMIGTGGTAAQQWCVLSIEKQHVERRKKDCQQLPVVVFWLPPPAVM